MNEKAAQLENEPVNDVEGVVELIKQALILGSFRPRERLVEDDLCQRFDVSRYTLRAAFTQLGHLGLVIRRPNKGVVVRDFEPDELDEIFDMRALLQGEAARRVDLPASSGLLKQLDRIHADFAEAVEREDIVAISGLYDAFSNTLFEAANNRYLTETIKQLRNETLCIRCYSVRDPALRQQLLDNQSRIIDALRKGERAVLEMLVVDQIWLPLNVFKRLNSK